MHSAIYLGQVRHRRFRPRAHAFDYRLYMMYLDLAELPKVFRGHWFWSTRGPALVRFDRRDYLGNPEIPLEQAVRDHVETETGIRPTGAIRLLTHLRYFGHTFNPVSFYYCFNAAGTQVETIVAEITNTPWGERHAYVLSESMNSGRAYTKRYQLDKIFHVSPFMDMVMHYDWRFSHPGEQLNVHMENLQDGKKLFDATLTLDRRPLTSGALAYALLAFPLVTVKVVSAIYWQALRLWLKRIPTHTHPGKLPTHSTGGADTAKPR
jgi:uncharacterized protein